MNLLLISPFFAPENQIASHRISKFAEYWAKSGQSVQVITRFPAFTGMEIPESDLISIHRVKDLLASKAQNGINSVRSSQQGSLKYRVLRSIQSFSKFILFPDHYIIWSIAARKLVRNNVAKPDCVVVSVGPLSALILGKYAAKYFGVPLVVDYRDLITDPSVKLKFPSNLRKSLVSKLEDRLVHTSRLISAVTEPMRDELETRFGIKSILITNGYEPRDFVEHHFDPDPDVLHIAYVGSIYPGKRDPSPLLRAIALLNEKHSHLPLALDFYGKVSPEIIQLVGDLNLKHYVFFHGLVPHQEAVKVQINADILLLLYWNHPSEEAVYTGKLFEYIGAKRPILCMGLEKGIGPSLIIERKLGAVINSAPEIAEYLQLQLLQKAKLGATRENDGQVMNEFTREAQSIKLLSELEKLIP